MNAILRTSVAVWSIVFVAMTIPASLLSAKPLHYKIGLVADARGPANPLDGATLSLDLIWDAATLTPLDDFSSPQSTAWPVTNTTGSLTVSGSAGLDGVYTPSFPYPNATSTWRVSNFPVDDTHGFPHMEFQMGGITMQCWPLGVRFADGFISGPSPFYPKPFNYSDGDYWGQLEFFTRPQTTSIVIATVVSASVVWVPEPSSVALGSVALLSLAALRRRK